MSTNEIEWLLQDASYKASVSAINQTALELGVTMLAALAGVAFGLWIKNNLTRD